MTLIRPSELEDMLDYYVRRNQILEQELAHERTLRITSSVAPDLSQQEPSPAMARFMFACAFVATVVIGICALAVGR